ncbi:hypothetical protein SLS57_000464 [Botryosphaeria dothidea]
MILDVTTTSLDPTDSTDVPSTTDDASSTTTYPPEISSATVCLSSWSSWEDIIATYPETSTGTWAVTTPPVTLSGYVYYTTPAPPYYTPPPACTLGVELCSSLSGYSIVGSSPTTFTISATTEIMSGVIPASQLVPTPSCSIGEATCSKLLDAGIVWFDDWASKDWRNCEMTPPGIGPVALTPTDFLLPPPPTPTKANTAAPPTTKRRTSTLPQPTATGLESEPLGYLIPASALVPGEEPAPAAATAPPRAAATALPQSQTLTLVVSAPGDGRLSTTVLALALAPAPTPSAIATLAGQPVLFDPAAGVRVGSFPIAAGAPAVNVGGTLVRVLPGGAAVVVGGQTVRLPGVATAAAVPVATVGGVVVGLGVLS